VNRLIYGGRFTVGILYFAVEAEYLHGSDIESFPGLGISDTVDRVKVGLRSTIPLYGALQFYLRGGGQMSRDVNSQTVSGVTTTVSEPVVYYPYGGFGFRLHLLRLVALTADITTVFHNFPSMNNNEYQATTSLAFEIP
jgi:hypothetical protein